MYRYIGNKTKLIPEILKVVSRYAKKGQTVCDLMAGTGVVSSAFRDAGYRVVANDVMSYSYHHLNVGLMFKEQPSFKGLSTLSFYSNKDPYGSIIDYLNSLKGIKGYFFNEFSPDGHPMKNEQSRGYFTSDNACKIDAIRKQINDWSRKELITNLEKSLLLHTLIMAVNEVANISGTYGYYLASFKGSALKPIVLKKEEIVLSKQDNVVLNDFAENIANKIEADVCYIDPPYMKRQYAANYHILETLALGDNPETFGKSGLRDWWNKHSKFCTKTRIFNSFDKIFDMRCSVFAISYSEDGLIKINDLINYLSKFGKTELVEIEYKRFRSNQSNLDKTLSEYIIIVRR